MYYYWQYRTVTHSVVTGNRTNLFEVVVHASVIWCEKRDCNTRFTSSTSTSNTMSIILNSLGHIIVDHIRHVSVVIGVVGVTVGVVTYLMSIPRPATSVATKMSFSPLLRHPRAYTLYVWTGHMTCSQC